MDIIENTKKRNLRIFICSILLMTFSFGLLGPFYLIFINKIGGSIENFGTAVGILTLSGALMSFIAGRYSDKLGRKPFLIIGCYASAIIVFLYTIISSLWQLYLLQILSGLIIAVFEISELSFLADFTKKQKRGAEIGRYFAFVGVIEALAIFLGGFIIGKFDFEIVFYIVSIIFVISATIMFKLKERTN